MRSFIALAVFLIAHGAYASNVLHTSTVKSVYQLADGRFVLIFDADSSLCTNASSPKFYYLGAGYNGMTVEAAKNAYALALIAYAMGKRLQIKFDDASSGCYINTVMALD